MADQQQERAFSFAFALTGAEARACVRAIAARQTSALSRAPLFLALALGIPAIGLLIWLLIGLGVLVRLEARSVLIAAVLAYFTGFAAAQLQARRARRIAAREFYRQYVSDEQRKVEIMDDGVISQTSEAQTRYRWSAIEATEVAGPLILIWSRGGATTPIPLRILKEEERDPLIEMVKARAGLEGAQR